MDLVDWIVKTTGKIGDNFNKYKFYVKQEPEIIDSSSIVVIHTFNSRDMTATIPCSFRWFSIRNGVTTEAQQFKGNTYICEPADVGCILQVEITSSDPECPGTALMSYGPVKFDVLLKKEVEIALSTGESNFYIDIGEEEKRQECKLKVSEEKITLSHISSEASFTFNYNMIEPKFEVLHKIPTKVRIIFNPKYYDELIKFLTVLLSREFTLEEVSKNPFIEIGFNNRKAKDSFIFIAKAFNTKKLLKTTSYVSNLEKQLDFTKISEKGNKTFDYIEHASQLERDILKLLEINSKNFMEKRIYLDENKKLEKEIEEIVSTYVKIIEEKFRGREDFEQSFIVLKEKEEEIKHNKAERENNAELEGKLSYLENENEMLKAELNRIQSVNIEMANVRNLSDKINYDPFKKKSGIHSTYVQVPVNENDRFEEIMKVNETLKAEMSELRQKYEQLEREHQKITQSKVAYQSQFLQFNQKPESVFTQQNQNLSPAKIENQYNVDLFNAKSVNSLKAQNHNESHFSSSLLVSKGIESMNPEKLKFNTESKYKTPHFNTDSPLEVQNLEQENTNLREQVKKLQEEITLMSSEFNQKEQKYKKKISELSSELSMYRKNNDLLNRSQQLSMEMEEYNQEQQDMLKKDNEYLKKEVEKYKELCSKYMTDAKKYKLLKKETQSNSSSILQEAGI